MAVTTDIPAGVSPKATPKNRFWNARRNPDFTIDQD
jgi:hypothetical protein